MALTTPGQSETIYMRGDRMEVEPFWISLLRLIRPCAKETDHKGLFGDWR